MAVGRRPLCGDGDLGVSLGARAVAVADRDNRIVRRPLTMRAVAELHLPGRIIDDENLVFRRDLTQICGFLPVLAVDANRESPCRSAFVHRRIPSGRTARNYAAGRRASERRYYDERSITSLPARSSIAKAASRARHSVGLAQLRLARAG